MSNRHSVPSGDDPDEEQPPEDPEPDESDLLRLGYLAGRLECLMEWVEADQANIERRLAAAEAMEGLK
jgi:hypothetical protein